jgi:hypothetical protein
MSNNDSDQDPPVRSPDPFRKASDPLSRETAAGDDDRKYNIQRETEIYTETSPDSAPPSGGDAQADRGGSDNDRSGDWAARQQAREAGSGTTGHEVEPEPNDDMNLEGFDKKRS